MCNDDCGGCGGGLAEPEDAALDRILAAAQGEDATLRPVVLALKDRLVARGLLTAEEEALIASLVGAPLDTPLSAPPEAEANLRVLCGALLLSPRFFLAMDGGEVGPVPALALDMEADRADAEALVEAQLVEAR
jgi:hypothetical protein